MKALITLLGVFLHLSINAANHDDTRWVYWISTSPPEIIFVKCIQSPGTNDNLQALVENRNCAENVDPLQSTVFIMGYSTLAAAGQHAMPLSRNRNIQYYVYTVLADRHWYNFGASLRMTYRNFNDMQSLAALYEADGFLIHYEGVHPTQIFRAKIYSNNGTWGSILNSVFRRNIEDFGDPMNRIYHPVFRGYTQQNSIIAFLQNGTVYSACEAYSYCLASNSGLYSTMLASPACGNMNFIEMPIKNYIARKIWPILSNFTD
jgi:hypothetical protein